MKIYYKSYLILLIMNSEKILENIKKIRKEKGFTQEQMADELKISRVTYYNIENGKQELSIQKLEKIIEFLNINILDLIQSEFDNKKDLLASIIDVKNKLDDIQNRLS